ncbi:hypothetical protein GH714_013266 [Hevea brasiliensis]|uniref:BHLH domain-containing protein n=1 Tax=Hevea brasiliensis TaxID=3981 RepID=A0A6A6M763_HEVBR|nr:hypothetical protein GH714_013266 [Hevea brasiliensis]
MSGRRRSKPDHQEHEIEALFCIFNLFICRAAPKQYIQESRVQILEKTCNRIKRLRGEIDELSKRISELMTSSSDTIPRKLQYLLHQ